MSNTHIKITINDPDRWYLSHGKIRKHYLQIHSAIWSDPDFLALQPDAKLLFFWLKNVSIRENKPTFSVCLNSALVLFNGKISKVSGLIALVKNIKDNNIISLQTKLRVPIEEKKRKENKENIYSSKLEIVSKIVDYLNNATGKKYRADSASNSRLINALLNNNYTYEDFTRVIDIKCSQWKNTDMEKYLRPQTLFGSKFDSYLNEDEKITEEKLAAMFDSLGRSDK